MNWRAPAVFGPHGEDERILRFLGPAPGIFVDVGANHPIEGSQTYLLEKNGWTGLLIEPLEEMARELRRHRTSPVEQVACGAPANAGTEMRLLVAGVHSTLKERVFEPSAVATGSRLVPVRTLDELLDKHAIRSVDFLSIDVEGAEIDVLSGFSLETFTPRLVLLEDHVTHLSKHRHMSQRGYRLARRTGLNSWYVPRGAPVPVSLFGRYQLVRKYYLGTPVRWARYELKRLRPAQPDRNAR